ncbi:MAG: DUF423 domain-containing protein [Desulfohalobiaceae bacterium]
MQRHFLILAGGLALLAVGLGAFGAHVLEGRLAEDMHQAFETGVQYHLAHALGLGIVALTMGQFGSERLLAWSARLMGAGILLFSGSIYVMALSGIRMFAVVTPVGGVAFLLAWGLFIIGVSRG